MSSKLFDRSNIAETPNPKPLTVQRVSVSTPKGDGTTTYVSDGIGFIRNTYIDPAALTGRI